MASDNQDEQSDTLIPMTAQQLLRVALVGMLAGLIAWGGTFLLDAYVFKSIVCEGTATQQCTTSLTYSGAIASVAAAGLALLALVKLQVFRSLLVVIAATVGLWGLAIMLITLSWPIAALLAVLLFGFAYALFAWIVRMRSFLLALIIIVVLIVTVRLVLNS